MMRIIALAAVAGIAAAKIGAPAAPNWPKEFEATIAQTDLRRNFTDKFTQDFSVSNNATKNDYSGFRNTTFIVLSLYAAGREYNVDGQQCFSRPINGFLPQPPVNNFTYNGTISFQGATVQQWAGTNQRFGDLAYLCTNDNNQYPVAFTDYVAGFQTVFSGFMAIPVWPSGTFAAPPNCN